jgi:drug/metabolite transporter (DMT)-like permease
MVVFWGLSWPAMKICLGMVPPLWLAALRFGTASFCLFMYLGFRGQIRLPPRGDWPIVASVGGLQMMVFTGLGLVAMRHTDAGRAALLAYTTPIWVMLGAWLLLKQRPTRGQLCAILIGGVGILVVCSPFAMNWHSSDVRLGNGLLLLAAISWALVILHVRRHRWCARPIELAPWQMLFATIPLIAFAYVMEGTPTIMVTPHLISLLFFIGPVATSICFVISLEVGRRVTTFMMSNATLGVPTIGIVSSSMLLGEPLSLSLITGLCLVGASVVLAAVSVKTESAPEIRAQKSLVSRSFG